MNDNAHYELVKDEYIYNQRYKMLYEAGIGTFGKVIIAKDTKYNDYVAIKIIRNIEKYKQSALIERDIIYHVNDQDKYHQSFCIRALIHLLLLVDYLAILLLYLNHVINHYILY